MSTPIETNTEGLQEILQTIYNLPSRSGGGSAEPDLAIIADENWTFSTASENASYNIFNISFDTDAAVATCQKIMAGKAVHVTLTGRMPMNSYSGPLMTTFHAGRVLAYGSETFEAQGDIVYMVVRFECPTYYYFLSFDGDHCGLEYRFVVDPVAGTAALDAAVRWDYS